MLIGLNTNTLFDRELDRELARQLFRNALEALTVDTTDSRGTKRNSPSERKTA